MPVRSAVCALTRWWCAGCLCSMVLVYDQMQRQTAFLLQRMRLAQCQVDGGRFAGPLIVCHHALHLLTLQASDVPVPARRR